MGKENKRTVKGKAIQTYPERDVRPTISELDKLADIGCRISEIYRGSPYSLQNQNQRSRVHTVSFTCNIHVNSRTAFETIFFGTQKKQSFLTHYILHIQSPRP